MKKLGILGLLVLSSGVYAASCPDNSTMIFGCVTTNDKMIAVCDSSKKITYAFGRENKKPELSFSVPRQRATTQQWAGIGRHESYSVSIPNGKTIYTVFSSIDKHEGEASAGVLVEQNGKALATVMCDQDIQIIDELIGIDLPATKL